MSEAALNKSLDDLIAEQRAKQKPKRSDARGNDRDGGRAPRGRSLRGALRGERTRNVTITVQGGGISKARGGLRGRGGGRNFDADRQTVEQRRAALEGNAKWGHDRFEGGTVTRGKRDPRRATTLGTKMAASGVAPEVSPADSNTAACQLASLAEDAPTPPSCLTRACGSQPPPSAATTQPVPPQYFLHQGLPSGPLFISNLNYEVSEDDIKELFETCGPVVKHMMHFDASGRSEGTAEVIFSNKIDAERAMKRYNNVQLDGQPMMLELVDQVAPGDGMAGGRVLSSGLKVSGGGSGRPLTMTRHFAQATSGLASEVRQPRGRGSIKSRVGDYMME